MQTLLLSIKINTLIINHKLIINLNINLIILNNNSKKEEDTNPSFKQEVSNSNEKDQDLLNDEL